jgi:uncharacterized membrane protein YphA (DoxX/SURF4 family)
MIMFDRVKCSAGMTFESFATPVAPVPMKRFCARCNAEIDDIDAEHVVFTQAVDVVFRSGAAKIDRSILLGETPSTGQVAGVALVIAGLALATGLVTRMAARSRLGEAPFG